MLLASGIRLGPYEILTPIGAGGMGEGYKARDTRLNRIVAIKKGLTPSMNASGEAHAIASLNDPHLLALLRRPGLPGVGVCRGPSAGRSGRRGWGSALRGVAYESPSTSRYPCTGESKRHQGSYRGLVLYEKDRLSGFRHQWHRRRGTSGLPPPSGRAIPAFSKRKARRVDPDSRPRR